MAKSKQVNEATASPAEPVVSEVGDGADARKVVRVGSWELTAWTGKGDEEPRIRDLDEGARLKFADPSDIKALIRRHWKAGNLNDYDVGRTVRRRRIGAVTREVEEFWLTEPAALFIASKSETPEAVAVTKDMIRVFMLARRGLLPSQRPSISNEQFEAMLDRAAKAGAAAALAAVAAADLPTVRPGDEHRLGRGIGKNSAETCILDPLRQIARLKAQSICNDRDPSVFQSILKLADTELRRVVGHSTLVSWEKLPIALLDEAANAIARMRVDAENLAFRSGFVRDASGNWVRSQANAKQLALPVEGAGRRGRRRRRMFDDAVTRATDRIVFGVDRDPSKEPN
ncbi:hypothetical protein [Sorangium sp. So ce233]|uniref:hypothetical protein n=1 Tax=Sorangium sp. So ce233 TaxID=3133290 RepID=UPI003F63AEF0